MIKKQKKQCHLASSEGTRIFTVVYTNRLHCIVFIYLDLNINIYILT